MGVKESLLGKGFVEVFRPFRYSPGEGIYCTLKLLRGDADRVRVSFESTIRDYDFCPVYGVFQHCHSCAYCKLSECGDIICYSPVPDLTISEAEELFSDLTDGSGGPIITLHAKFPESDSWSKVGTVVCISRVVTAPDIPGSKVRIFLEKDTDVNAPLDLDTVLDFCLDIDGVEQTTLRGEIIEYKYVSEPLRYVTVLILGRLGGIYGHNTCKD